MTAPVRLRSFAAVAASFLLFVAACTSVAESRGVDTSLVLLTAVGASTASNAELLDLQAGSHDPRQRGFTLQQAELGFGGAIAGWGEARAVVVAVVGPDAEPEGETVVELEEAVATTARQAGGWQAKVGLFFTDFGRINGVHPHEWSWQDQPFVHSRVFGGDGMRAPGASVSWRTPELPDGWFGDVSLAVQNASGETMPSFLADDGVYAERAIGGRLFTDREVQSGSDFVWSLRATTELSFTATTTLALGASVAEGPNATGGDADTWLWGADFVLDLQPARETDAFGWTVQGEFLSRRFDAAAQVDSMDPGNPVPLPGETLTDRGGYVQVLCDFAPGRTAGWAAGFRAECATGSGASYLGGGAFARSDDPWRADRIRLSPMLQWRTSAASRLRLQYNYDDSDHLDGVTHSVWLGLEVRLGHAAQAPHPGHGSHVH